MNNEQPVAWYNADDSNLSFKNHGGGWQPLYTHLAKTLTDEEIMVLYEEYIETQYVSESNVLGFGRAILRKAQEK